MALMAKQSGLNPYRKAKDPFKLKGDRHFPLLHLTGAQTDATPRDSGEAYATRNARSFGSGCETVIWMP